VAGLLSDSSGSLEKLRRSRALDTSRAINHDNGATWPYQGHCVWLEWQSAQARRMVVARWGGMPAIIMGLTFDGVFTGNSTIGRNWSTANAQPRVISVVRAHPNWALEVRFACLLMTDESFACKSKESAAKSRPRFVKLL
jgi:hypothetical protein